ncbi:probable RNA-binding protein 19 isoform X3 [Arabidopsis lyrata subsp. lyrata]|uniref:probable RNA-binding protein 19 isoform X3 n=1 Tax=Arabidopsis lyrata subsp. lyrata TaxID=81972 RepID=UPI000A29B4C0|nr:probable RNA-binding protein 19 isoform X3 [Arabidopsis lyrata subsp. lyrata]|eukprot:XP_020879018.1 probable RNA-binding protein 19 isoform X3 [Arabidopsis lyrata subsp. lyrata]
MSRIIVKNVPKYVTEDQLRGIFSRKGEITDVKLKRLSDGTSRQFAYIGFRNEQEAQDAITYFNKSFIDTLRISVLVADPPPRTQGKADEKSEHAYAKGDKKIKKKPEADHDPQLQEFLHEHKKLKFWSNDMCIPPSTGKEKVSPSRIKKNLSDSDSDCETDSREDAIHVFPIDGEVEADRVDKDDDDDDGHAMDGNDDVLDTSRLFVHGLPYSTAEEELTEHFSKFGDISEVHLVLDKDTRNSRGMAYVLYLIPESAKRAMEKLDKLPFQGRTLHILPAKPCAKSAKQVDNSSNLPKSFKQKREEQRKASEACGNTKAWNSFFMRPDTILENLVRSYGVTKSELLDRECEDPAVRLALGETKVIMETKEALAKAGVRVASLEEFAARKGDEKNRSKHILLVKNLPFASTEKELAQMFRKFGSLDKIILPPTKTMALVVFLEPAEARAALNGMAYKRYKDVPLYLEWAPRDILEPKALADNKEEKSAVEENDARRVNLDQQVGIYSDIAESNVLHVKNLSFKTTDEGLKKHLTGLVKQGKILSVKQIIRDWKRRRSSGYGFVEFDSVETATSVYRDLPVEGNVLDGHSLILSYSENKRSETVGEGSDKVTNLAKLHVKNVAFEATEKEVRQLFSPFGQIKRVGLPLKTVGKYAGFGFVEFGTMQEALNAKKAFSNTHFYGRQLVLEWAHDDKRKSCAAKYMDQENDNPKKRKRWTVVGRGRETSKKRL